MPDERRKGPTDRRRGRSAKATPPGEQSTTSPSRAPDENASEAAALAADELDASIRARQQEGYGEVL